MKLYIDKENLLSLLKEEDKDVISEEYNEIKRMIKKHLDLVFNFDKSECRNNPLLIKWLKWLMY